MADPESSRSADEGTITRLYARLRRGESSAADGLWEHYFPRMVALARKVGSGAPPGADAEDAALSAFASFWLRAAEGDVDADLHRDNLWNLLALITARKIRKQIERGAAQKRGGGKVLSEAALAARAESDGAAFRLDDFIGQLPAQEFDLACEELLLQLDEPLRRIAILRLMGHTNDEIAAQFGCTRRKIERKLAVIRLKWERHLAP